MINNTKTTNTLLLIIVIPIVFYILKTLSFIFIPLVFSMFIALLFLPFMRWLKKYRVPKPISIILVILIIGTLLKLGGELLQLASKEILAADANLINKLETNLTNLVLSVEAFFGIQRPEEDGILMHYLNDVDLFNEFGTTLNFLSDTLSMTLMTVFFSVLWLSESINFQKLLNSTILKQRHTSVKVFRRIEKDLIKFIIVKIIISLITGLGFYFACLWFNISFPIFWGLFAFAINFLQMIGSFISVVVVSVFGLVELDLTATLLIFTLVLTGIQALMGGVVEPVFMGKSFSINVISILVMLMFWGYLWGIPGLIMSIPITVFIKILLEQYQGSKVLSEIMSGK